MLLIKCMNNILKNMFIFLNIVIHISCIVIKISNFTAYYVIFSEIDECSSRPCQNGGFCTDGVNGYTCDCAAGYVGTDCRNGKTSCSFHIHCVMILNVSLCSLSTNLILLYFLTWICSYDRFGYLMNGPPVHTR